jgi:hypothetical protein
LPVRRRSTGLTTPGTSAPRVSTLPAFLPPCDPPWPVKVRSAFRLLPSGISSAGSTVPLSRSSPFLRLGPVAGSFEQPARPPLQGFTSIQRSVRPPPLIRRPRCRVPPGVRLPGGFPSCPPLSSPRLPSVHDRPSGVFRSMLDRQESAFFSRENAAPYEVFPLARLCCQRPCDPRPTLHTEGRDEP